MTRFPGFFVCHEHEAIWRGPPQPARYVTERTQLNVLAHLAAELDTDDAGSTAQLRAALRKLGDTAR
jgi:hypothetical protein